MLTEAAVEVEVARGHRVGAQVHVPRDARGTVAILGEYDALTAACGNCGLATVVIDLFAEPTEVDNLAALFATAVTAITNDQALQDRPIGYFGQGVGGAAVISAAALHTNDVAAVVALDAPLELVGMHLSGVKAPTLLMIDPANEALVARTRVALPPLPNTSSELRLAADPGIATEWFDRYLRGVMRGMRRELWRSA